ncbi:hypothetical protein JTB14_024900 [Gonioctena quinquepunctata]|nr:hypothetical protein JTB14_024900 [Gonioctena quinquepunctata]
MAQENKRSFDPMFTVSNRTKLIFKKLEQRNQEVNVLIPQINAGSDVESESEDEDSFEPLKNIDYQNLHSVDFENILHENSNNSARESTDKFEISKRKVINKMNRR